VELREIEMFLALAEELHFGRTAERLYVSQSRVSQVIQLMETRVGGRLFERTSRRVQLTPLGAQLRDALAPSETPVAASPPASWASRGWRRRTSSSSWRQQRSTDRRSAQLGPDPN
jgi:DNA-binding transcriptional LysR family regulator